MSKFRELVENIRNYQEDTTSSAPQQSKPKYKFLTHDELESEAIDYVESLKFKMA